VTYTVDTTGETVDRMVLRPSPLDCRLSPSRQALLITLALAGLTVLPAGTCFPTIAFESPPPDFLDTLAAAYAEAGLFDKAIDTAQQARRLSADSQHESLAQQIQERLRLYEQRRPYHDSGSKD